MAASFQILLFGDETADFRKSLLELCERHKGVVFSHFVTSLNAVLREEVRRQPRHVKKEIPPFSDVLELVKAYHEAKSRNQILETTLACICQLGSVIRFEFRSAFSATYVDHLQ